MRYTLGLDIGIASVGWCVVEEGEKPRIVDLGVRTFPVAEHPKDGSSLALPRRMARGIRRRLHRRRKRLDDIQLLCVEHGLASNLPYRVCCLTASNLVSNPRFMRLLVMYDLPVGTKENRRVYQRFRKFLIEDGYDMLQFSIYHRIVSGEDNVNKHLKRLQQNLPSKGSVRFMQITERQFQGIRLLVGTKKRKEKEVDSRQLLLF